MTFNQFCNWVNKHFTPTGQRSTYVANVKLTKEEWLGFLKAERFEDQGDGVFKWYTNDFEEDPQGDYLWVLPPKHKTYGYATEGMCINAVTGEMSCC